MYDDYFLIISVIVWIGMIYYIISVNYRVGTWQRLSGKNVNGLEDREVTEWLTRIERQESKELRVYKERGNR